MAPRKKNLTLSVNSLPDEFTIASVVPSNMNDGYDFLSDIQVYNAQTQRNDIIDLCWKLYENEGIVGSVIDTMIDLALTKGSIEGVTDENLKAALNYWADNVNNIISEEDIQNVDSAKTNAQAQITTDIGINSLCEGIMLNYLLAGDAYLLENWAQDVVVPGTGDTMIMPKKITLFNAKDVKVEQDTSTIGSETIKIKISDEVVSILKDKKNPRYQSIIDSLSPEVLKIVQKGETEIALPPILVTHFKRKGYGRLYGIPYLKRAFSAISSKRRLQALDEATIAGMIQRLTILKVGHPDPNSPYHVAKPARVSALQNAIRRLPPNKMIVWGGNDIEVIDIGPDGKVLSFDKRFTEADDSISLALGIPRILIDGSSTGTSARDWVVVIKTVSTLERIRAMLKSRIDRWLRAICIKNGYEDVFPTWRWSIMTLKDERIARTLILKAYEDGLIGRRDSLNFLGWEADEIIEQMIKEKEDGLNQQIDVPNVSFSSPANQQGNQTQDRSTQGPSGTGKTPTASDKFPIASFEEETLLAAYRGINDAIYRNKDASIDNVVAAGFYYYSINVSKYAESVLRITVGDSTKIDNWVLKISAWASRYVEKFKKDVLTYIANTTWPGSEEEKVKAISAYLVSQEYRIKLTVDEVRKKAYIAAGLIRKEENNQYTAKIKVFSDKCDKCLTEQGNSYSLDQIFNLLPVHIGCTCYFE